MFTDKKFLQQRAYFMYHKLYADYIGYAENILDTEDLIDDEAYLIFSSIVHDLRETKYKADAYNMVNFYVDMYPEACDKIYGDNEKDIVYLDNLELTKEAKKEDKIMNEDRINDAKEFMESFFRELEQEKAPWCDEGMEEGIEDYAKNPENPLKEVSISDMVSIDLNYRLGKEDGAYNAFPDWFLDKFMKYYGIPSEEELKKNGYEDYTSYKSTLQLYAEGRGYFRYKGELWCALKFFPDFTGNELWLAAEDKNHHARVFQVAKESQFTSIPSYDFTMID